MLINCVFVICVFIILGVSAADRAEREEEREC